MLGAVQLGLIAACVVLFVPMGMAGWHLSRNKMLFFSCALFITLAVGVHLMPYFPSIPDFISQSEVISVTPTIISRDSCIFSLHNVMYTNVKECQDGLFYSVNNSKIDCNQNKSWEWVKTGSVPECNFQKLKRSDASDLLNGSWVVVAGDSQARLMVVSLLELVMGSEGIERVRGDLFKRHSDYSIIVDDVGLKLDFIWAPYVNNLTEFVIRLRREKSSLPDVLVMGAGLWDMLHTNNVSEYGVSLRMLRDYSLALLPVSSDLDTSESKSNRFLHLFWIGMPTLITSMLNTEEKKEKMTSVMSSAYDNEVNESKLLRQFHGPLLKLDIRLLSGLCGPLCTADGMHYVGVVYDSAVHILLNALLIESNQKLQ